MKSTRILVSVAALLLALCVSVAAADKREGKIVSIDPASQSMVVQGTGGDQWTLYWTETTKFEDDLTVGELKVGDVVEFDSVEKDGKIWITKLDREHKAD